jgi:hypothetical protein
MKPLDTDVAKAAGGQGRSLDAGRRPESGMCVGPSLPGLLFAASGPPSLPDTELIDYVRSSARLLELPLDEAQVKRVATHLTRTKAMAAALQALPLAPGDELAEIYRPAPFPDEDPA